MKTLINILSTVVIAILLISFISVEALIYGNPLWMDGWWDQGPLGLILLLLHKLIGL